MDDDKTHTYLKPSAAAARWMRLYGELPGQIKGIDYERLHMSMCDTSMTPQHDIAMEKLDEFRGLSECLLRAKAVVGWEPFRIWLYVRVVGHTVKAAAVVFDMGKRTVERRLRTVDSAVRDELVERHLMVGYAGRDLLEVSVGPVVRQVRVWLNEAWEDEDE